VSATHPDIAGMPMKIRAREKVQLVCIVALVRLGLKTDRTCDVVPP
jgi:hypothetical protein